MSNYSKKEQKFMLSLAKEAITSVLNRTKIIPQNIPVKLREKRACFVTLTINKNLHGCIGHIFPIQELWYDIVENAKAAAFDDPRFSPLQKEELPRLTIELSILSTPKPYTYRTVEELLMFLKTNRPGIILSKGFHNATFLPQVWADLPDPKEFLTHLCLKAHLDPNAWLHGVVIDYYTVESMTT